VLPFAGKPVMEAKGESSVRVVFGHLESLVEGFLALLSFACNEFSRERYASCQGNPL
jgi:hypothetical protein